MTKRISEKSVYSFISTYVCNQMKLTSAEWDPITDRELFYPVKMQRCTYRHTSIFCTACVKKKNQTTQNKKTSI